MARSDALDLEPAIFKQRSPRRIAESLKRSAERSVRRKSSPFRSAMSMLTFYINRGGQNLSATRKQTLERAKDELRQIFGREPTATRRGDHGPLSKRSRAAGSARGRTPDRPAVAKKAARIESPAQRHAAKTRKKRAASAV